MMFTNSFTFYFLFSVLVLSIFLYFLYLFIADYIEFFDIYKTTYAVMTSPLFYLVVVLLCGIGFGVDMLYRVLEKEKEKPLYLLYRSLMEGKMEESQKVSGFRSVIQFKKNRIGILNSKKENS